MTSSCWLSPLQKTAGDANALIRKVTLHFRSQLQIWEARARTVDESPGSETQERACRVWIGFGHLAVMCKCPFPLLSCRLGPVETEISQMKLMRTSGGGSTYSSSRLSSLWLLVHSDTLPCFCKTVLFLQPPKGVQQWLNTPKWPYKLFYYFSRGGGGGRQGGRNTFSARRFSKNPTRPVVVCCSVNMQSLQTHLWLKRKWTRGALIMPLRLPWF